MNFRTDYDIKKLIAKKRLGLTKILNKANSLDYFRDYEKMRQAKALKYKAKKIEKEIKELREIIT